MIAEERLSAIEYVAAVLDEFYRHGSCDVRVIVSGVDRETYDIVEGVVTRRYPDGELKVETPAIGLSIEWVLQPPDAPETTTIPIVESRCAR